MERINSNTISGIINCKYNCGRHGERYRVANPNADKAEVICSYSFDIPYALEHLNK
ncbi:hypothetical protein J4217_01465 [Candidatus Pacearchaeota archaeon]|nr:hypothetical protein [Candidatus Pacearchaeota archaeon]